MDSKGNQIRIVEDSHDGDTFVSHYRQMLKDTFVDNRIHRDLKRYLPLSYSATDQSGRVIGGVTGWISFNFSYIEAVWVDKGFRRQGVARRILESFERQSREKNCIKILTVVNNMSHSEEFWTRIKFVEYARIPIGDNGVVLKHLCKDLATQNLR